MHVEAWLPRAAALAPERVALRTPAAVLTYAELAERGAAGARRLAAAGVEPGQRVAIALEPGSAFVEALHACFLLGAVAMPIDVRLTETERQTVAAGADALVDRPLDGRQAPGVEIHATHDLEAVATAMHTSGTSGEPRRVDLT